MRKGKLALATAAASGIVFEEIYRFVFCRFRGVFAAFNKPHHAPDYYVRRDGNRAEFIKRKRIRHERKNKFGQRLVGYYYPAGEKPSGKVAFIVHGYHSDHAETAAIMAEYYFSRGWDIFACDHISHGESQGQVIGYDYYESLDCLDWLAFLRETYGETVKIILHGFSMGGGTVLKMSDRVPENVKFICSDSGFADAVGIIRPNLGPLYEPIRFLNKIVGGYDIEETDVRENLRNARVPVLFVHGEEDPTVPVSMGKELYELCPTEKDKLFTKGAMHIESNYRYPKEYAEKLDQFIKKYIE